MSDFKAKIHQIRFRLEELTAVPQTSQMDLRGLIFTSKKRGREGRTGWGRKGREGERGRWEGSGEKGGKEKGDSPAWSFQNLGSTGLDYHYVTANSSKTVQAIG